MDKKKYIKESAQRALQKGDVKKALKFYEELIELDPDDMQARNTLGDIYSRIGMRDEAVKCFTYIAKEMSMRGFYHKSIAMMKKALRIDKNDPQIYIVMADAYSALKLIGEARNCYNWLLDYYSKKKDNINKIEILKRLYELTPNDPAVKRNLMDSLAEYPAKSDAAEQFFKIGINNFEAKNYSEAYSNFIKCLECAPDNLEASLYAVECLIKEGKIHQAVEIAKKYNIAKIENTKAWQLLSRIYYASEEYAEALSMVKKVLEKDKENIEYRKLLGRVYAKLGRDEEAKNVFKELLKELIDSKKYEEFLDVCSELDDEEILSVEMREKRAEILKITGDIKGAAQDNLFISLSYESDKKLRKALIYAERALELCPDDESIRKQVESLKKQIEENESKAALPQKAKIEKEKSFTVQSERLGSSKGEEADISKRTTKFNNDEKESSSFFNLAEELKVDIEGKKERKNKDSISNGEPIVVDEILRDFKRAVECTIEDKDMQTHFDLGIAYMEMELFSEAIEEFKKSINDESLYVDSLIFTAKCEFSLGNREKAIGLLEEGINRFPNKDENYLLLQYNKALLYESMDSNDNALQIYEEILEENPFFKDVKSRINQIHKKIKIALP
ncbi:MAG: hypothetical protein D6734_01745 [Candidatus Schekmanbacteria bacterium]|nr:MAG: hypothetical protein D6734_01745 [Candidatus Schekmanbacteria bacterium]